MNCTLLCVISAAFSRNAPVDFHVTLTMAGQLAQS